MTPKGLPEKQQRPSSDLPRAIAGNPTDEELAAITALFDELSAARTAAHIPVEPPVDVPAWQRLHRLAVVPVSGHTKWTDAAI